MQFAPVLVKIILNVNKMQLHHRITEKHEGLHATFYVQFFFRTMKHCGVCFVLPTKYLGALQDEYRIFLELKNKKPRVCYM